MSLDTIRKQKAKLDELIKKFGKKELLKEFKEFFKEHEEVTAIRWKQYTPHFADGDPCVFGRYDFMVQLAEGTQYTTSEYVPDETQPKDQWGRQPSKKIKKVLEYKVDEAEGEDGDEFLGRSDFEDAKLKKMLDKLEGPFDEDTEDVFLAVFGDGVQVTCDAKGFTVEEHDHD